MRWPPLRRVRLGSATCRGGGRSRKEDEEWAVVVGGCVSGDGELQSTLVCELIGCEGTSNAELMGDVMGSSPAFD